MKNKIKFGLLTLLVFSISLGSAWAQQTTQPEKPNAANTLSEFQNLKKDWDEFQSKAEAKKVNPALEKEYNSLVDRLETICDGIQPAAKASVKMATTPSLAPATKPKKEQVAAMK